MTEVEAGRLGAATGRTPNRRLRYLPLEARAYGYDMPCPFLGGDECRIYGHRPLACRKDHHVDADDLFCRLDLAGEFVSSAPQLNPNLAVVVWGSAIAPSMGVADIRDRFPGERELERGPVGRIGTAHELLGAAGS